MGLFTKKIGTIFLKEDSDADTFLQRMEALRDKAGESLKPEIEKQLKMASYGKVGEDNIAFELKNSGIDMYVLRDIYLEIGDMAAQIDYIIVTRKHIFILECKNLIGNIEIDNTGNFIRTYELFGKKIKEGIYSPITQNERHIRVLKEVRRTAKTNIFSKLAFEKNFDNTYKSIVVLANPKTYLNARFAKKEIKNQVIRADRLIKYIEETETNSKNPALGDEQMLKLAQFFLEQNQVNKSDYAEKYEQMLERIKQQPQSTENPLQRKEQENATETAKNQEELISKLKAFRLEQSRKENLKPYYIFNDSQMMSLIERMPKNSEELLEVSGFGQAKVEKYGKGILDILNAQ